jgi:hypothetical protein
MVTHLLTNPYDLLAPDLEVAIERVWVETLKKPTSHPGSSCRREEYSFREFAAYDAKGGTTGEYLPTHEL